MLSRAGERSAAGTNVDLGDLAADALRRWRPQASERGIALVHRARADPGAVWAARADLERALDALIENALGYSPAGQTVTIVSRPAAGSRSATAARASASTSASWCSSASAGAAPG